MSLKILHVLDHSVPLHSGYTFRTRAILRQQCALGWETEQLTTTKHAASAPFEDLEGMRFHRTVVEPSLLRRAPVIGQLAVIHDAQRRLEELIPQLKPDLIHAHSPCLNGIAALRVGRRMGIPVLYEMRALWEDAAVDHGTTTEGSLRYRLARAMETWLLRRVDAITVICEGLKREILDRGIDASRVTLIPNAVDIESFPVIEQADPVLRRQLGLEGAFVLGFIGSFYGYEGINLLLEAMPAVLAGHPQARVLLVGGGYEEERLKLQASRLGIADKVVFTGRVAHSAVNAYYSVVDVLVYPRKSNRLTNTVTPLKPLEAMAQGRLLAASDVGGHRELIEDGRTGYLFAPDSPPAIAACLLRILGDSANRALIRANGRYFVEEQRTWANSVARYRAVYSSLVHRPV